MTDRKPKTRSVRRVVDKARKDEDTAVAAAVKFNDSFENFASKLGIGADNAFSFGTYGFNPVTRIRTLMEWIYRGSWIAGIVVDAIAEDMTRQGVQLHTTMHPNQVEKINRAMLRLHIWRDLRETIKWARLYGGAIAVVLIDGQKPETPLRVETIPRGAFKGLMVLDRWMVNPSLQDLVTEFGPSLGKPRYYDVTADAPAMPRMRIHYSRVIRLDGVSLPYWQRVSENLWGMSVIERLYDRLLAFDQVTTGTAQLTNKAHLRTWSVDNLREILSAGGPAEQSLLKNLEWIRQTQSSEGITLIDSKDKFESHQYGFAGLSDVMLQLGQQLSGATQTPMTRLFGQSPAGMSATGESDMRTYYDSIRSKQEMELAHPLEMIYKILARSEGVTLDEGFGFEFKSLWLMSDEQKSSINASTTSSIVEAYEAGIISQANAMKELRQSSRVTGVWSNVTDEDIEAADAEPPDPSELASEGVAINQPTPGKVHAGVDDGSDTLPIRYMHDLQLVVEARAGEVRYGRGWKSVLAADYGYIRGTASNEGIFEQTDCFIGTAPKSQDVWIINQTLRNGAFDEHKCCLAFSSREQALDAYLCSYSIDMRPRIQSVVHMTWGQFTGWLAAGNVSEPARGEEV